MWAWCAVVCAWAAVVVGVESSHKNLFPRDLERPGRIVGGAPVKQGELLWQVSLQLDTHHFCGGTLISPMLVVTAAHCTRRIDYNRVRVVTGTWDLSNPNRVYKVEDLSVGPYDELLYSNDIALIKLDVSDAGTDNRAGHDGVPIALETRKEVAVGKRCTISGWGKTSDGGTSPQVLLAADVTVKSDSECIETFSRRNYQVFRSNLCAGGEEKDACQGDSGGPLVCCSNSTIDVGSCRLAGITSWGIGCATRGFPGVYTEMAHFADWVKHTVTTKYGEDALKEVKFFGQDTVETANQNEQ